MGLEDSMGSTIREFKFGHVKVEMSVIHPGGDVK